MLGSNNLNREVLSPFDPVRGRDDLDGKVLSLPRRLLVPVIGRNDLDRKILPLLYPVTRRHATETKPRLCR